MKKSLLSLLVFFTMSFGLVNYADAQCGITFAESVVQPSCFGGSDGSITLNSLTGNNPPFTFAWTMGDTTQNVSGYYSGSYQVYITDSLACQQMFNIDIPYTAELLVNANVINESGAAMFDGSIDAVVSGGTPPYSFTWSNSMLSQMISGLSTGNYDVLVTDSKGCTATNTFFVDQLSGAACGIVLNETVNPEIVDCNGSIDVYPTGGMPPYKFYFNSTDTLTNQTSASFSPLCSGFYSLIVEDSNLCTQEYSIEVPYGPANCGIVANELIYNETATCDGSIELSPMGGMSPYTYNWNTGDSLNMLYGLCQGFYDVTITDMNLCSQSFSYQIKAPECMTINVTPYFANAGMCDGGAEAIVYSGGVYPYTYLWSTGDSTSAISGLCAGEYWVTVTDSDTCQIVRSIFINENQQTSPCGLSVNPYLYDATYASCNGGINIMVSGGISPYTYNWSNGDTTNYPQNLCAGQYFVTITTQDLCQEFLSYWVNEQAGGPCLNIAMNTTPTFGTSCSGSIDLMISGGVAPYTYLWENNSTLQNRTNLCEGYYYITVTDSLGCSMSNYVWISNSCNLYGYSSVTQTSLQSSCDGGIEIIMQNGNPPYTYLWDNGSTTQTRVDLCNGYYNVTITDSLGCTTTLYNYVGSICDGLNVYPNSMPVSTPSSCDGSASVSVYGGVAPYSFVWNTSQTTDSIYNLCEGEYSFTVTDSLGCTKSSYIYIGNSCTLYGYINGTSVTIPGACNGTLTAIGMNGSNYSFIWENGDTNQVRSGLCEGQYYVTISDSIGCTYPTSFYLGNSCSMNAYANVTNVSVPGACDGSLSVIIYGGTAPYTYNWTNFATTEINSNLCEGYYEFTVTDSIGCLYSNSGQVGNNCAIYASANPTNVSLPGLCDGSLEIVVNGGIAPYTYLWFDNTTSLIHDSLCEGYYYYTVTDSIGCTTYSSYSVGNNCAMYPSFTQADATNPGMCDGTIQTTVSGGIAPYTFVWSNGATTANLINLCKGYYDLTVTDSIGCTYSSNVYINDGCGYFNAYGNIGNISSAGACDGSVSLNVYDGTLPYTYQWSNSANTDIISGLCEGSYDVTVSDSKGCVVQQNFYVGTSSNNCGFNINPYVYNPTSIDSCNGGIDIQIYNPARGTTGTLFFEWNTGDSTAYLGNLCQGEYWLTISDGYCSESHSYFLGSQTGCLSLSTTSGNTDSGLCNGSVYAYVSGGMSPYTYNWNTGDTASYVMGLCYGEYWVTVTDVNGCTMTQSVFVNEYYQPNTCLNVSPIFTDASQGMCDGSIDLTVSGGVLPYTFVWSNGVSNDTTTTGYYGNLCAGEYFVTIYDADTCMDSGSVMIKTSVDTCGYTVVPDIISSNDTACDGQISIAVTGGTQPYNYMWSTGSTLSSISNLCVGEYFVTVNDMNNCPQEYSFFVPVQTANTCNMILAPTSVNSNYGMCDGQINLTVDFFTVPLAFVWSNGGTTQDIYNLCSGSYSVTVTDSKGCVAIDTVFVGENSAPICNMTLVPSVVNASFGLCDASVNLVVNSYTAPLSFSWTNGSIVQSPTGLCPGTYSVTVTDSKACLASTSVTIIEQASTCTMTASINNYTNVSCYGGNNGYASVVPTGGSIPYSYKWSTNASTPYVTGLYAGTYTVTITDSKACQIQKTITINQPTQIIINGLVSDVTVLGAHDGAIDVTVSGGQSPYTYIWTNGSTTEDLIGLFSGAYLVQVKDSKGCSAIDTFKVKSPNCNMSAIITSSSNVSCYGGNDGAANVLALDGDGIYTYNWSNGSTTASVSGLLPGLYFVTVSDSTGCTAMADVVITQPTAISVAAVTSNVTIYGGSNGKIQVSVFGGEKPYTYLWNNGATTSTIDNLIAGTYDLTVTDSKFCSKTKSFTISQPINNGCNIIAGFTYTVGTSLDVSFTNVSVGTFDKVYWEFGDWTTPNTTLNPTYTYAEAGYKNVILTVINSATGCKATYSQVIYVEGVATVSCDANFEVYVDNTTQTVGLIDLSQGNIGNWSWDFGNGTSSSLQNPTVTYIVPGSKTIRLSIVDATGVCSDKFEKVVFVGTPPCTNVANFASVVNGMTTEFLNYSTGTATKYTWEFGDGFVTSDVNPSHTYSVSKSYNVRLKAMNADGTCLSQKEKQIVVGTNVPPMIEIVNNTPNVDAGSYVNLFAEVTNYTADQEANLDFYWILGDGSYYTTQEVTDHLFPVGGTYFVKLIVIDPVTKLSSMASSEILVVGGDDISNVGFVYTQTDNGVIIEALDAISGADHYPFTYMWNLGDNSAIEVGNSITHIYSDGIYDVCLTAQNSIGVHKTTCGSLVVHTDTLTTPCLAVLTYSINPSGNKALFWSTESLGNPSDYDYLWDFGDSTTSVQPNPEHTYSEVGYYLVSLTVTSKTKVGCSHTAYELINVGAGNNGIRGAFGYLGEPATNKAAGYSVDFVGAAFGEPSMIEWDFGDSKKDSTTMKPKHTYYEVGDYNVCLTISDPYSGSSDTYCENLKVTDVDLYTPIVEAEVASLNSYPNPFSSNTTITYTLPYNSEVKVELFDILGKHSSLIENTSRTKGSYQFNLQRKDLKPGIYHIKLSTERETLTKRIVIVE